MSKRKQIFFITANSNDVIQSENDLLRSPLP